jgi:AraC-like DNA-binding protein
MEPRLYRPEASLARFVEYFWTFDCSDERGRTLKMFPTGVSGVLFQHHNGRPALGSTPNGRPVTNGGCPTSFVYGKRTRPAQTFATAAFALSGVVLKPQGLSTLLKTPPADLSDGSVPLNEFSKENIRDRLLNARSSQERVTILSEFLRAHADNAMSEDLLITESLSRIRRAIRWIRVPDLLRSLKVSERQFQRRFIRAIGVPPHQYIRIARFRKAMQLMKTNQFQRLSDMAYDLNYVDQSHFIKDIEAFSGYTPKRLVQTIQASIDLPCAVILPCTEGRSTEAAPVPRIPPSRMAAGNSSASAIGVSLCGTSSPTGASPHT